MPRITFMAYDGLRVEVDAESGHSMMEAALAHHVPGIDSSCNCGADCECDCPDTQCHVIVDPAWFDAVGPAGEVERKVLARTPERAATSRLSCRIRMNDRLDGIVVRVPEFLM